MLGISSFRGKTDIDDRPIIVWIVATEQINIVMQSLRKHLGRADIFEILLP